MSAGHLERLLAPHCVAVVGASERDHSVGQR
jgi:acyl-CoA synthetase (NDP forming)